jgi:hypothetical protein
MARNNGARKRPTLFFFSLSTGAADGVGHGAGGKKPLQPGGRMNAGRDQGAEKSGNY